jgi:hypothetical protein
LEAAGAGLAAELAWPLDFPMALRMARLQPSETSSLCCLRQARILLEAGAVVDVCGAAAYGMNDRLRQILASHPKDADDLQTVNSPLGWSAYGHQPESAKILLQ